MESRNLSPNYLGLLLTDIYFLLLGDTKYQLPKDLRNDLRMWYFHARQAGFVPFAFDKDVEVSIFSDVQ